MAKMVISNCPTHGAYDKLNLCPCYDPGGPMAHARKTYGTKAFIERVETNAIESLSFCPIHGKTTINSDGVFQCGCFDENGNKIVHLTDNPNESEEL
jgi:hypothetical protein